MYYCSNCKHKDKDSKDGKFCIICGDNVTSDNKIETKLDINNDGKIDDKDASLASKVMNKYKSSKKKKR